MVRSDLVPIIHQTTVNQTTIDHIFSYGLYVSTKSLCGYNLGFETTQALLVTNEIWLQGQRETAENVYRTTQR